MENQPIEAIAQVQESRPRNWDKLKKAIAGVVLASTVLVGAYLDGPGHADSKVKVNAVSTEIDKIHDQEIANTKAAYDQAAKIIFINQLYINKQAELKFYSVIAWNNAILQNKKIPYDSGMWDRLHNCEQGDSWSANGYNSADPGHQLFQGGLGMSTVAWSMAVNEAHSRGVNLPSSALGASIDQQKQGAQALYDTYGGGGWGCPVVPSG